MTIEYTIQTLSDGSKKKLLQPGCKTEKGFFFFLNKPVGEAWLLTQLHGGSIRRSKSSRRKPRATSGATEPPNLTGALGRGTVKTGYKSVNTKPISMPMNPNCVFPVLSLLWATDSCLLPTSLHRSLTISYTASPERFSQTCSSLAFTLPSY